MEPKDRFNKLLEKYKEDREFILDGLILRVSEDIARLLAEQNMSRTELAKKLGCSPAYVTKLLRGSENLTLKKLFEISQALNANLNISISMNAGSFSGEAAECVFADDIFRVYIPNQKVGDHAFADAA